MKKTRILILGIIIGVIATTVLGVYATNTFNSKDISYTNESTEVTNVKDAVDELFNKLENIHYLADVVAVGDYVAYDAGRWTETVVKPTSQGQFGGYTKGDNKANTVDWCFSSASKSALSGWRVLSIDSNTKTVTLIHAGIPECYYHQAGYSSQSITDFDNRATSEYLNSEYAQSAHMLSYE